MKQKNLIGWLTDPRSDKFFGRGFSIRAEVLACLASGNGSLADVARRHGVTRQAVHRHAVKARKLYGFRQAVVDLPQVLK